LRDVDNRVFVETPFVLWQKHVTRCGGEAQIRLLMTVANFPMGLMSELMCAVVFAGICDRHPAVRFVLEEAGVGWALFLFWRFDREYGFWWSILSCV
jgi:hypothetical protein